MFFFPFLFPSYYHSVVHRTVCLVFDGYNQSSFVFFYVVRCIDASTLSSMLASPFPPSFLHIYSLSTSSLRCNALCIVKSFLVLMSICLSSSLVHFREGPEYLTKGIAQAFIPFYKAFLLDNFVLGSFLVLLRYSFLIFSFIFTCLMVSASRYPGICRFPFLQVFQSCLDLVVPFCQSDVVCHFS